MLPYPVSGLSLTPDEALSLSVVWACIDSIAKAIASCAWHIYRPNGPGRRELLEGHPTSWLLNTRPNPDMTAIAFREALLYIAIPFGNAYAEIVRDGGGRVAQLWPLEHDRVTPRRDPSTQEIFYEYAQPDGSLVRLEQRSVFHLRGPSLSGFMGENVVARAAKSLSVAAAQERYSASFFGQGAHPSGALKYPGKLGKAEHERLKTDWKEKREGLANSHRPIILEGGMEWVTISVDPQKAQLVEERQFSVEDICRWFGVPPHKVQHLLRSTFNNIEHLSIEFVRDALTPWARRLEQEADYKFFSTNRGPWLYTCIDTQPLSYGDAYSRAQAHAIWRQNGIMSANEIRAREGMNDAGDDGDVLLVQSNLTTVEKLLAEPKHAPAPAFPPGRSGGDDEDDALDPDVDQAELRDAVVSLLATACESYARRMAARKAAISRQHADAAEPLITAERSRLRGWLVSQCNAAFVLARSSGLSVAEPNVDLWADRLDAGEPPVKLAELVADNALPS